MKTLSQIKRELSAAFKQTHYYKKLNETYYPAFWSFRNVSSKNTSTSCCYNKRVQLAANFIALEMFKNMKLFDVQYDIEKNAQTLSDAAQIIYRAQQ